MLDCLLSYFGLDENDRPGFRRYFCYHVLAGPGPTAGAGVAVILTLAVHSDTERCDSCQHFHTVESGGRRRRSPRRSITWTFTTKRTTCGKWGATCAPVTAI